MKALLEGLHTPCRPRDTSHQCQRYAPNIHQLEGILNLMSSPWPFAQWGLYVVGALPKGLRKRKVDIIYNGLLY